MNWSADDFTCTCRLLLHFCGRHSNNHQALSELVRSQTNCGALKVTGDIVLSMLGWIFQCAVGWSTWDERSARAFKYKCVELECSRCVQSRAEQRWRQETCFLSSLFFSVPCEPLAPLRSQSWLSHDRTDLNINAQRPSLCEMSKSYLLLFSSSWATLNT